MKNVDGGAIAPGWPRVSGRRPGARALATAAILAGWLAACGGGGGGASAPAIPAKPVSVLGVTSPLASQSASGATLLAFRAALVAAPAYPVVLSFTSSGGNVGTACGAGIDYIIAPAPGLTRTVNSANNSASGELTLASAASGRQISLTVCPGAGDKTIKLSWSDGAVSGVASGTIRSGGLAGSARLNDTGITTCASADTAGLACPQAGFGGQDGDTGRDADAAVTGAGASRVGAFALDAAPAGDCIQDNVTGLVWEGKSGGGLHQPDATFTWFNSDSARNGGAAGFAAGGVCGGAGCDTEQFVAAVNAEALCGYADWRVPSAQELAGVVDSGLGAGAAIDARFANQGAAKYWSASPKAFNTDGAWFVDFASGAVGVASKSEKNRLRLVRGR